MSSLWIDLNVNTVADCQLMLKEWYESKDVNSDTSAKDLMLKIVI